MLYYVSHRLNLHALLQTPFLAPGCQPTSTVMQPVLWSRPWGGSWPLISPTSRSTSSLLTTWPSCLHSIYLMVC